MSIEGLPQVVTCYVLGYDPIVLHADVEILLETSTLKVDFTPNFCIRDGRCIERAKLLSAVVDSLEGVEFEAVEIIRNILLCKNADLRRVHIIIGDVNVQRSLQADCFIRNTIIIKGDTN